MKLSPSEKLITIMLCDLFKKLDVESDIDPEFLSEAITSGNMWAIENTYVALTGHDNEVSEEVVSTVHDTLEMYELLEDSYDSFTDDEKAELVVLSPLYGKDVQWPGFDGNNESEYRSAVRFMLNHMDYYPRFKDRAALNSHSHTLEITERMLSAFKPIRSKGSFGGKLSVEEVAQILNERTHPSRR